MSKHSDYYPQFEPDSGPMVTDAQKIATLQNDVKYWRDYALSLENLRDNTLRLNRMLRKGRKETFVVRVTQWPCGNERLAVDARSNP